LDETGGPNHVGNFCFSPIHADTRTDSLIYTPSYYYLGHFSKFIRPGAKRLSTVSSISFLESTSFINEDGKIATIVMNRSEKALNYKLYVGVNIATSIEIPARAIQTIVY
jgi:glucosylceramidase